MNEKVKGHSGDDILAAFLITYAEASFQYEKYMPEVFMKFFGAIVFAAFAAGWLWLSFRNGCRAKLSFPIFAVLFWLAPFGVMRLYSEGPEFFRFSIIMYVLSEFLDFLICTPAAVISDVFGISEGLSLPLLLILCAAAYMCGIYVDLDRKGNYTRA